MKKALNGMFWAFGVMVLVLLMSRVNIIVDKNSSSLEWEFPKWADPAWIQIGHEKNEQ